MDSFKVVSILLIVLGFSTGGYFVNQNNELVNQINSLDILIDQHENTISNLTQTCDNLVTQVSSLEDDNEELTIKAIYLQSEITSVTNERAELVEQVDQLHETILVLENEKQTLEVSLESKRTSYNSLDRRYTKLEGDYYQLELDYTLEKELRIGNSLESYYDNLREGLGPTGARYWWTTPEKSVWQAKIDFAGNLALHDLWRLYWPDYETDYEEMTGENSYETAWSTISCIMDSIGISSHDTPTKKITKILNFLDEHIHYESEVNDVFLAPVETIGFRSGDCDDYSILAAALFETVEIETAIGFFKNENDEYHAMTLIHLDKIDYSYWHYDDLTNLGLSDGCWLIIEPQTTISDQGSVWIGQWSIFVAEELDFNE